MSILFVDLCYGVLSNVIIDSAVKYLESSDIGIMIVKFIVFGVVIVVIFCGWGIIIMGGVKGVGESIIVSVVISFIVIFVVDFVFFFVFF